MRVSRAALPTLSAALLVALFLPAEARGQATSTEEGTLESCRDGVDNDEDGHVDCHDAGCLDELPCQVSPVVVVEEELPPRRRNRGRRIALAVVAISVTLGGVALLALGADGAIRSGEGMSEGENLGLFVAGLAVMGVGPLIVVIARHLRRRSSTAASWSRELASCRLRLD